MCERTGAKATLVTTEDTAPTCGSATGVTTTGPMEEGGERGLGVQGTVPQTSHQTGQPASACYQTDDPSGHLQWLPTDSRDQEASDGH